MSQTRENLPQIKTDNIDVIKFINSMLDSHGYRIAIISQLDSIFTGEDLQKVKQTIYEDLGVVLDEAFGGYYFADDETAEMYFTFQFNKDDDLRGKTCTAIFDMENKKPIGLLLLEIHTLGNKDKEYFAVIERIAVRKQYKHLGFGSILLQAAMIQAKYQLTILASKVEGSKVNNSLYLQDESEKEQEAASFYQHHRFYPIPYDATYEKNPKEYFRFYKKLGDHLNKTVAIPSLDEIKTALIARIGCIPEKIKAKKERAKKAEIESNAFEALMQIDETDLKEVSETSEIEMMEWLGFKETPALPEPGKSVFDMGGPTSFSPSTVNSSESKEAETLTYKRMVME